MRRITALMLAMLVTLFTPAADAMTADPAVELLRLAVPAPQRQLWLEAEARTWQPWLEQQTGFLGRDLYWDPVGEQGVLLIRWASRDQWKAIPAESVERVQADFEAFTNTALGRPPTATAVFPLVEERELRQQTLPTP
ncbi:antibiotic biosynthesis monooxygenase-like domain containing protein [Synechococcus sp. A15-127]|uniref:TIGR03792 family protein n=1 Tax=Synechococcus sp. A15-127 TaxID=1050624 RepID=UPI001860ED54|nr:TIGR03792 family protein [Synechococcus sp. A15-127]QNI94044.1 antibiotic biosynthesis monooxygenase-like domain containing protein [Synechococcus sp. A15-127]